MMKKEYIKTFTEVLDVYAEELMDSFHVASPLHGTIGASDDEGDPEDNTSEVSGIMP
jgi:hypothetical protein